MWARKAICHGSENKGHFERLTYPDLFPEAHLVVILPGKLMRLPTSNVGHVERRRPLYNNRDDLIKEWLTEVQERGQII
jgi:hypothetical protein